MTNAGGVTPGTSFTTSNGGVVVVNADGTFDYTPSAGFIGVDTFDYSVADPSGEADQASVEINVYPDPDPGLNDNPDANDDVATTPMNISVIGNALNNDTDLNSDPLTVSSIDGAPVLGTVGVTVTTAVSYTHLTLPTILLV